MRYVKRLLILLPLLGIFMSLSGVGVTQPRLGKQSSLPDKRTEFIYYQQTFENGNDGWTHYDGSVFPINWHIFNDGTQQANAWWMGDPALANGANIGGYHDKQYLVLDTPSVLVPPTNANLTFKLKYYLEPPDGAPAPWTGWDACNVRISTDNGATWTVLNGSPAYNITSAHSFGFEHGEGTGIAGWGGNSMGWGNAVFSLSAYTNQNVRIRFAFGSDDAYSTVDNPSLFGMLVDDIAIGSYNNNGVNDGQMTWASLVPVGGDIWHIAAVADAPSPTQAMLCQNATGSYNPNMSDYLVSQPIVLPQDGWIRADFMIKGSFSDMQSYPNAEEFNWEMSVDNGLHWYSLQNPYNDPIGWNTYWTVPADWTWMSEFAPLDFYISDYNGLTALFRISFHSDGDTPIGTGIMVDNFTIWHEPYLAQPTGLTAVVQAPDVILNWSIVNPDDITRCNIYRDGAMIGFVPGNAETYMDELASGGFHSYYVTAVDDSNESQPSNTVQAFIMSGDYAEFSYDDNTAEAGFNVGPIRMMAVKFDAYLTRHGFIRYVKIYVYETGTAPMILRIFDSNGTNGLPGTQLFQFTYPATSIIQGWNYIQLPQSASILVNGSPFYLALMEYTNASSIGLDTGSSGHGYKKVTTSWEPVTQGEIMIRALFEPSDAEDDHLQAPVPNLSLYPNPFRDQVTISLNQKLSAESKISIYNAKGQLVHSLKLPQNNEPRPSLHWDGTDARGKRLPAGVYLLKCHTGVYDINRKILLLK